MRFMYVRPEPGELAGGRPLAFGDVVTLSRSQRAANSRPIDAGSLIEVPRRSTPPTPETPNTEETDS